MKLSAKYKGLLPKVAQYRMNLTQNRMHSRHLCLLAKYTKMPVTPILPLSLSSPDHLGLGEEMKWKGLQPCPSGQFQRTVAESVCVMWSSVGPHYHSTPPPSQVPVVSMDIF